MADEAIRAELDRLRDEEVLPVFAGIGMQDQAEAYPATVVERFCNPFLDHRLAEILINHEAKKQRRFGGLIDLAKATIFRPAAAAQSGACFRNRKSRTPSGMTPRSSKRSTLRATGDANGDESGRALINGGSLMKTMLIAAAVAMAAALSAPAYAVADQPVIPVIVKDTTSGYWQIVFAGARKAGQDLGVKVPELGAQSEADINGEITILENAVAGKPAAVVIAPTSLRRWASRSTRRRRRCRSLASTRPPTSVFTSFLTTDNEVGGQKAADGMADAIKAKYGKAEGEVALITHLPGVGSLEARNKGFKEELAEKYPGLKLVADKVSDGNATTGLNIMTDLITAMPNLRGVFADNLIQCQGASQAVAENKKGDTIKLVCFDADDKLIGYLKDGTITALLLQDPYRMGYDGVKTALAASKGEKVPANVDTGANLSPRPTWTSRRSMRCSIRRSESASGAPSRRRASYLRKAIFTSRRGPESLAQRRSAADDVRLNQERFAQERDHGLVVTAAPMDGALLLALHRPNKRFGATHALKPVTPVHLF